MSGQIMRLTEVEDISAIVNLAPGEDPLYVTVHDKPYPGMDFDQMAQMLTEPHQAPKGYYAYGTPTDGRAQSPDGYYETAESWALAASADKVENSRIVMAHIYEEVW